MISTEAILAEARRREVALASSGLPECRWGTDRERMLRSAPPEQVRRLVKELQVHRGSCSVCQGRDQYIRDQFGDPLPMPGFIGRLGDFFFATEGFTSPAKVLIGMGVGGSVLLVCAGIGRAPHPSAMAYLSYVFGIVGGAGMAWGAYQILGLLTWAGAIGRWLARCVAGVAGMLTFVWAFRLSGQASALSRSGDVMSAPEAVKMAVIMAAIYATLWPFGAHFRPPSPRTHKGEGGT